LSDIPPAPRGVPQIQVTFDIDANGILGVSAKDLGTARETRVTVTPSSGLTQAQIDTLIAEAAAKKADDAGKRTAAELRNRAETLIYTCNRSLEAYGHALPPKEREAIAADAKHLEELLASNAEVDLLRDGLVALEASSHQIYEAMLAEADSGSDEV
jgi:molecular chaperone DnaK